MRGFAAWLALPVLAAPLITALAGCGAGSSAVHASGIIEIDEIDVASMIAGRLIRLTVDEGDAVRAGDTLAVLDREEVAAEFRAQTAQVERAVAQAQEVTTGPRAEEVQRARADVANATAQLDLAERDAERAENLFKEKVLSQAEWDRARSARETALARRDALREQLRLLEAGSRREQITAARQGAAAARAQLMAAKSRLGELVLTAPISGVVLLKNFDRGELVPAGQPVVSLGDPDSLWMRVYVAAPMMGRIRLGAPVTVQATGFGKRRFAGRVVEIATRAEFTPRVALTEEERSNLVFGVKVELAPTGGVLKAGLPADATIEAPRGAP